MSFILRTEFSVTMGDRMYEVHLVNHRGWAGPGNNYDVNELEIVSYEAKYYEEPFTSLFSKDELDRLRFNSQSLSLNLKRLENGEYDDIYEYVESYKKVVERFRNLAIFL